MTAQFHCNACIGCSAHSGIDNDGDLSILQNHSNIVGVADSQSRTDGCAQRHHRDAADLFQSSGNQRVIAGVDHHIKAFRDEGFCSSQRFRNIRVKRFLISKNFQFHQLVAVEEFSCHPAGPHSILGGITAGGVGQDGVLFRGDDVQQAGFIFVLAQIHPSDGDGNHLSGTGFKCSEILFEVFVLATADDQARAILHSSNK